MSKFEQFFSAGGGSSYLGVPYPKASTEYKEVSTVGLAGTSPTQSYAVLASRLPVASDPSKHVSIHRGGGLIHGRNMGIGAIIWSLTAANISGNWTALWVNPVNDDIYVFLSSDNLTTLPIIKKIDLATATVTTIFSATTVYNPFVNSVNGYNGAYVAPRDPINPDTCIWDAVGDAGTGASPFLSHITMNALDNAIVKTTLSVGAIPKQTVMTTVQYVTADRTIILGGWTRAQESDYAIGFFITRGSNIQYVEIPFDGNLPLPNLSYTSLSAADFLMGASHPPAVAYKPVSDIKIIIMGQSVCFACENNATFTRIVGKRLFDRVDFDRWLTAVCDAHNMPTGVGYF